MYEANDLYRLYLKRCKKLARQEEELEEEARDVDELGFAVIHDQHGIHMYRGAGLEITPAFRQYAAEDLCIDDLEWRVLSVVNANPHYDLATIDFGSTLETVPLHLVLEMREAYLMQNRGDD